MPGSNYFLQALLDSTTDNVVLIDPHYKILCFNQNFQDTLELYFKRKAQEGDNYLDYVVPELQEAFINAHTKAAKGDSHHVERETRNGEVSFWFQYKFNPVYTQDS